MKTKKQDMEIEELFRRTLGDTEIIPEASTGANLMRQVARREFMRFNPGRFNIYYLGALVVAGITATVILTSGNENSSQTTPPDPSSEISRPFYADSSENKGETTEAGQTDARDVKNAVSETTKRSEAPKVVLDSQTTQVDEIRKNDSVSPLKETTEKSTEKKSFEGVYAPEYSKLQEGFRTVVSKIDYSKRTVPRQNVKITPVEVNDSLIKKDLFDEMLPETDDLREEKKLEESMVGASATEGCPPLKVQFKNKYGSSDSCRWTFGELDYSYENNPGRTFNGEGDHKVALDLYDNGGIQKNSSVTISVYPKPQARFETSPVNEVITGNEIIFHNRSLNGVSFRWDFGDGTSSEQFEPKHTYTKPGSYNVRLLVTSDYGCTDSVTLVKGIVKEK